MPIRQTTTEKRSSKRAGRTCVLAMMCLCALSLPVGADDSVVLTLEDSLAAAMSRNRSLLNSGIDLKISDRNYTARWNSLLPGIDASSSLKDSDELFSDIGSGDTLTFSASLSLSLQLTSKLAYSMEQTRIDYEASRIDYDTAKKQLIRDVEKNFYYLLAAEGNLDLLEKNQELAQKRYEQTQVNFRNGFASELEVLQSQVSAASYKPELSQARYKYDAGRRSFLILLGMDPESKVTIDGSLEAETVSLDYHMLVSLYLASRQDILSQQKLIETLENSKKSTRASGFSPSVTLSGGWSTSVTDPLEGESWQSDTWRDTASLGLSLTIPLEGYIPGSSQQTALKKADDQIAQAVLALNALQDSAKAEILDLIESLNTNQEILEQAALNADLALKSFEMTEASYNLGTTERLDVEDAQQAYLSAKQQYLSSQYDYLADLIDMKYALNLEELEDLYSINDNRGEQ